jgi:hypothetical protein
MGTDCARLDSERLTTNPGDLMSAHESVFQVTSNDPALFEWLMADTGAKASGEPGVWDVDFAGESVRMCFVERFGGESGQEVPKACICLIRFVDQMELQKLSQRLFPDNHPGQRIPHLFLVYRKNNEADFKMSCASCGQKLWVRDLDVNKRGRCPNCKKGFTLPGQEELAIQFLGLKQTAPLYRAMQDDPSSVAAGLRILLKRIGENDALRDGMDPVFRESRDTMNLSVD